MEEAEFDRFAEEYREIHAANIRASGESPEFFAEYKIADVAKSCTGLGDAPAILDFGAGVGSSVPYFRKYFPRCQLTCIDVSHKSLDVGRARFAGEAQFLHFDGARTPFPDAHFDLVFFGCVMHHIAHQEHIGILAEARRVLRTRGVAAVFEHNPYNPLTLHAVNTCPFDENAVLVRPRTLRSSALRAGFRDTALHYRIFFPHVLRALRPLEVWLDWLPLGAQYSLYARKE